MIQNVILLLVLVAAAVYLGRRAWRATRAVVDADAGCASGCGCSTPTATSTREEPAAR